jgi:MFS transporter, ACS family, D-galactonate transporter
MSRRWVVVGLIFLGILISYVDRGNLGIAASSIMRDFGLAPAAMGLLLSAFFWTYGAFQIPAGALVDRVGIRKVYAAAFLLWSLASAGIAFARHGTDIFILRLLLGLAEAVGPIASISFIRRNFAGPEQGLPTAIYIAGQNVGPAAGTLLGSVLVDRLGWRAMFAITGLGALLWLPFWLWLAPRNDGRETAESVRPQSPPWREALASPVVWLMAGAIFLSSYYWYFLLTWVPSYLTMSRGFSTLEMGRVLSSPLFAMAILNIVAGAVADRLARRSRSVFRVRVWFAIAGYVGAGSVLLLLLLPGREAVFPVFVVSVCSVGVGNANFWAIAQHAPPSAMVGRAIGFLNTISQLAGAAAPLLTGWILGPERQFTLALGIAGSCPLVAAVCLLLAGPGGLEKLKGALSVPDQRATKRL